MAEGSEEQELLEFVIAAKQNEHEFEKFAEQVDVEYLFAEMVKLAEAEELTPETLAPAIAAAIERTAENVGPGVPTEMLRMDERSLMLYREALKCGKEKVYNIRIMVVGPCGVGKTTLVRRLLGKDVNIAERKSTEGIDIHMHCADVSLASQKWTVQDKDADKLKTLQRLVKQLNEKLKMDKMSQELEQIRETRGAYVSKGRFENDGSREENVPNVNVKGNIEMEILQMLVENADKIETVEEDKAALSMWDFAGQFIYYTTHQAFLTGRAVYLLVIDLAQHITDLVKDDECFFDREGIMACKIHDLVEVWMNSIHTCSPSPDARTPPVILVGTHADMIPEKSRQKVCESIFNQIRYLLRDKQTRFHLTDEDFVIDNSVVDPKMDGLKRKIMELASQQPYWGEEVPARWLHLEQALMKLKAAGVKVIPYSLVESINKAENVQIETKEELDLFLRFLHEMGTILYLNSVKLRDKVVLVPQWFIDALKSLITAEMFVTKQTFIDKWYKFKESGKLTQELIDAVWTKSEHPDLYDNKEHILLLMEHMNIVARPRSFSENGEEIQAENYYIAPCMLRQTTPREFITPEPNSDTESTSVLCYAFKEKFLPPPIFHRLIAACLAFWPIAKRNLENLIFYGCCLFALDPSHRLCLHFKEYVIFTRITRMGIKKRTPDVKICSQVREFITAKLSEILGCFGQRLEFELCIQCPRADGDSVHQVTPLSVLQESEELPCDFHEKSHAIVSRDLLRFWFEDEFLSGEVQVGLPPEILRMDKRSQQLYREALKTGKEKVYNIRLMIVGHQDVGKTTLAKRILGEEVAEAPRDSTKGIEVHPRCCKVDLDTMEWIVERKEHRIPDNGQHLVNIVSKYAANRTKNSSHDISQDEKNFSQPLLTYTGQDIIDGVQHDEIQANSNIESSTIDRVEDEHIHEKRSSLDSNKSQNGQPDSIDQTRMTSIFNNSNNAEIVYTRRHSEFNDFVTKYGSMTRSKKIFCYVTMLDFAGQFVYYTTHQVFMSWRTIYLLVTDMSKSLDELVKEDKCCMKLNKNMESSIQDYAVYWLNSIYSHGLPADTRSKGKESNERETDEQVFNRAAKYPPVILVATHSDKVPEGEKTETRDKYVDGVSRILKERPQRFLLKGYFAISNFGPDADIDALKQKIVELAQEQDYWGEEIPGTWLALQQKLMELKIKGRKIIEYSDVEQLNTNSDVKIESPDELEVFLRFEHDLGNIVFFNTPKLRDKIVLDTDWLMDGVRILISPPRHVFEGHPELLPQLYDFLDTGRLTEPVIACLWSKSEQDLIHKNRDHLLDLMEKLSIIAKPVGKDVDVQDQKQYYWVPCVICKPAPDNVKNPQPREGMTRTTTLCFVSTTKFIHVGVFHRLVASLLSKWPSAEEDGVHRLYSGCCEFEVDGCHNLLLALNDYVILATMFRYSREEEYPDKTLCSEVRHILSSTLDDIKACISPNSDFDIRVMCDKSSTYTIKGSHAISNKKEVRCKCSKHIHSVNVEHLLKFWERPPAVTDSEEGKHPKVLNPRQPSIKQISNSILTDLSNDLICHNWKFFFRAIPVSDNELDEVEIDCPGNVKEQIYRLLRRLNQKGCLNETSIIKALESIGRLDLVDTYNRRF